MLQYPFRLWKEDGVVYAQSLAPLDNIMTYGDDEESVRNEAREALTGVLGAMLDRGDPIPQPPDGGDASDVLWVEPDPHVAWPVLLRLERERVGITQAELAKRLDVTFQAVQKWERSGANPTLATADRVMRALGRRIVLVD
jgi:DNA-binding XRE family transcriptional regulator/predicted RNase H-like HicB family nuclease